MSTAVKTQSQFFSVTVTEKTKTPWLEQLVADMETNRFGVAPMLLVFMACLGGIASGFAVKGADWELMAVAVSTAMIEILIIAIAPMRMVAVAAVVAFLVDLYVFIF